MNGSLEIKRKKKLLELAKELIFSTAIDDSASRISLSNMAYGLAKIIYLQEKLGIDTKPFFIAAPDNTITRNLQRWRNGFGYGGKITWGGEKDEKIVILDVMPNACGMLVGGLDEVPNPEELINNSFSLISSSGQIEIDGLPIKWNFSSGNHFINVFEVVINPSFDGEIKLPPFAFITHSSPSELKDDSHGLGMGLYYHKSKTLQEIANELATPFGPIHYLEDHYATKYYDFFKLADDIGRKRRIIAGKMLFGNSFQLISNKTHQGMINLNEVLLGSHDFTSSRNDVYPLTLRADLPCYLLKGIDNFSEEAMTTLNFINRARKYDLVHKLTKANILPHGGGYTFPHIISLKVVHEVADRRFFEVELDTGIGAQIFETPREMMFSYRGRKVLIKTLETGLGEIVAKLIPKYVLKI